MLYLLFFSLNLLNLQIHTFLMKFFFHFASLCKRARAQKRLKMRYEKVRLRFGKDVMVRPNYSVLEIGDSVRPNLGSVENIEKRFGRTSR